MNKYEIRYQERMNWLEDFADKNGRKPRIFEIVDAWGIGRCAAYNYLKNHDKLDKMSEMTPYEEEMEREMWEVRDKMLEIRKERGFIFAHEVVEFPNMSHYKFMDYPYEIRYIATQWSDYKVAHKMNKYYDIMTQFIKDNGTKPTSKDLAKLVGKSTRNAYMFVKRHGEPLSDLLELNVRGEE